MKWTIFQLLYLIVVLLPDCLAARNIGQKPNIIFIMTDDQGYRDVGYMGHPVLKTPNIDAMAENGLRLDRFYTASPVCSPTRASVLTGRHPARSGTFLWGHALRPQERTVIEHLNQEGYRTGFFGKWHLGSVRANASTSPGAQGFDYWVAAPNFYMNDPWMSHNGSPVQLKGEGSAVTAELAMDFIKTAVDENKPFISFIWTGSPHVPHEATPELQALYPDQPDHLKNYYGEISGIDIAVGMIRDLLRELDIAGNTLLIFTSDNGGRLPEADNGDLRGEKGELWEGGIRVPFVLEWPGTAEHRISHIPAGTIDLYPTFLDLAGIEPEEQTLPKDGISLAPLIKGEMTSRKKPMGFWEYRGIGGQAMASDEIVQDLLGFKNGEIPEEDLNEGLLNKPDLDYEGIGNYPGDATWMEGDWKLRHMGDHNYELYHLKDDLGEVNDLSGKYPDRVNRMAEELHRWQDSVIRSLRGGDY